MIPLLFLGVDITDKKVRLAQIRKIKGKLALIHFEEHLLEGFARGENFKSTHGAAVISSLKFADVLVRKLRLPLKKPSEIASGVRFQAESLLAYNPEKGLIAHEIVEKGDPMTTVTLYATKKDHYSRHLLALEKAHLRADLILAAPSALAALAALNGSKENELLVYLRPEGGLAALCNQGRVLAARSFELDRSEIQKTLLTLTSGLKEPMRSAAILSEDKADLLLVQDLEGFEIKPFECASFDLDQEKWGRFGLAIGLALAGMKEAPSFSDKAPDPIELVRRWKKPLFMTAALLLALLASLAFFGSLYLEEKEKMLLAKASPIFKMMDSCQEINRGELSQKLGKLEEQLEKEKSTFTLLPLVPKSSDLLAWLARTGDSHEVNFSIEELRYKMVSSPSLAHKNERYLVKVEIVLTAPDPYAAQELFLEKNPLRDAGKECEWKRLDAGRYRATFYLKDKTRYS